MKRALSPPPPPPTLETMCVESVVKQALAQPGAAEAFREEILALAPKLRWRRDEDVRPTALVKFTNCNYKADPQRGPREPIRQLPVRLVRFHDLPDFVQIMVKACSKAKRHKEEPNVLMFMCAPHLHYEALQSFFDEMETLDCIAFGAKYNISGNEVRELVAENADGTFSWNDTGEEELTRQDWNDWTEGCASMCFDLCSDYVHTRVFDQAPEWATLSPDAFDHFMPRNLIFETAHPMAMLSQTPVMHFLVHVYDEHRENHDDEPDDDAGAD